MRLGILIIGSLYWDRSSARCRWRETRLGSNDDRKLVRVPIRYGRKSSSRGNTFTMVFSQSCSTPEREGTALVLPVRADCCNPDQFVEEALHLWAAERNSSQLTGIGSEWGRVCVLPNPKSSNLGSFLDRWRVTIKEPDTSYRPVPVGTDEKPILDEETGRACFDWPIDASTNERLGGFEMLLMTATEPTLEDGRYPTPWAIGDAWKRDTDDNVAYFHNNRLHRITTFEDDQILRVLRGQIPNPDPSRPH
jgi:hypothetical protein